MGERKQTSGRLIEAALHRRAARRMEQKQPHHAPASGQLSNYRSSRAHIRRAAQNQLVTALVLEEAKLIEGDRKIYTQRSLPDNVAKKYPTVQAIWDRLNALVEKRNGKPAIDIDEMEIVSRGPGGRR